MKTTGNYYSDDEPKFDLYVMYASIALGIIAIIYSLIN